MTLTLSITNVDRLDNGMPTEFVLNRRGTMIGRAPTCDWSLPDPRQYVSSRHCEIAYRDGFYTLTDISTNGTILNGAGRMTEPRRIENGDRFTIGQYDIVARLSGEAAAAVERQEEAGAEAARASEWGGWESHAGGLPTPATPDPSGWNATPAPASGWGDPPIASPKPAGDWGAPAAPAANGSDWDAPPPPAAARAAWTPDLGNSAPRTSASDGWGAASAPAPSTWQWAPPPQESASAWSSAAPDRAPPPAAHDIWGQIAEGNVVDWARGGFGQATEAKSDPLGLNKPAASAALPKPAPRMAQLGAHPESGWGAPPAAPPGSDWGPPAAPATPASPDPSWGTSAASPVAGGWDAAPEQTTLAAPLSAPPPTAPPPQAVPAAAAGSPDAFIAAAGLEAGQLKSSGEDVLARAGALLRHLVAGMVVMVEARARAKSQMGAEATSFSFDGNNPLKFARTPQQALAQLLNPQERGFMEAGAAIEDAFFDLQSHQMATLKAMQGALRATLDRFSPTAIKQRATAKGMLAKIMPGAREAALWQAYEREFGGVAQGSDEAFMDVFAKEFRRAYEDQANAQRAKGR